MKDTFGPPEGDDIDCAICSNPKAATWRERYEHGCPIPGELRRCEWCGEPDEVAESMRALSDGSGGYWCSEKCHNDHKAANPDCEWFRGYVPIEDTLPGGPLDGIWENSGFRLERQQ